MDGGNVDLTLSEDPFDFVRLEVETIPILITICKIGEHCVVDPSAEEEVCSSASLVVGVANQDDKGKNDCLISVAFAICLTLGFSLRLISQHI